MLADSVRSVLRSAWPAAALRAQISSGAGVDELWSEMVALDWPALCIVEPLGGLGFGPVEAMLVHEGCGAFATPGPLFATTALFAPVLAHLASPEQAERWLPAVASGQRTGTAALGELRRGNGHPTVEAVRVHGGWRLDGVAHSVIDGAAVDHLVVVATGEPGVQLFVVDTDVVQKAPVRSVDATRGLATVTFDSLVVGDDAVLGAPDDPSTPDRLQRAVDHAVTCLAAEVVGTCATILDITLDHARQREQFGVKIGSFQALKHRLADAFIELEAARASVRVASMALAEDDPRQAMAASSAMALAGDAAQRITREGIQVLGGIGFTWEHDMHLYVKRAMGSSVMLGTAEYHRQRVANLIGLVPA
ncbi:MAG: acyl-CoA dehydrogenase family protein [Acidimicrobiales bacterium]